MGVVPVTVRIEDVSTDPVDDVLVQIYDANLLYITEGTTGTVTPGEVVFTLDGTPSGITYYAGLSLEGWSFSPAPTPTILVKDPPAPSNIFEFTAIEGTLVERVTLAVSDDELMPNPIEGVSIRIYDDADNYITTVDTDADGEASLTLLGAADPGVDYYVCLFKPGVIFTSPVQIISIINGEDNTFDFSGHVRTLPESTNANMCKLSGYLVDASLRPIKNLEITFKIVSLFPDFLVSGSHYINDPAVVNNNIVAAPVTAKTDKDGYIEVELTRSAYYEVEIQGWIHPTNIREPIIVPNTAGASIVEVLYPYIVSLTFSTASVSIAAGSYEDIEVTALASNTQLIELLADITPLITFDTDDNAVALIAAVEDNKLRITGISAGSTVVTAVRIAYGYAPRKPDVPALVVPTLTITVT